jgi:virginiamycin A acetyltransferase
VGATLLQKDPLIRAAAKKLANALSYSAASIPGLLCFLERRFTTHGEALFAFWSHCFAFIPGHLGVYLRRAFYRLSLDYCSSNCFIGFGTLFSHRQAVVNDAVYIGTYSLLGSVKLGAGTLIGSRVSILSGPGLHEQDSDGSWTATDISKLRQISIAPHGWIGEGAIVMADIGRGSMVAAGSVVSSSVPPGILVAGNPARFVRSLNLEA